MSALDVDELPWGPEGGPTMSPASRVRLMAASLSIVLLMMPHFCSTFIMASHPLWKV